VKGYLISARIEIETRTIQFSTSAIPIMDLEAHFRLGRTA